MYLSSITPHKFSTDRTDTPACSQLFVNLQEDHFSPSCPRYF